MVTSRQPQPSPSTPAEWEVELRNAIEAVSQTHDDPAIDRLLADSDNTFELAAAQVRAYVTDIWKEANEDRSLYGGEMRQNLESAIAGQKITIKVYEAVNARLDMAEFGGEGASILISFRRYLEMAHSLFAQLEYMRDHAPGAFSVKSLGYKGDVQTLHSLYSFLRHRLGEFSYDSLANLIDCGFTVEGIEKEVKDGKDLKNRLDDFRQNHSLLAGQTEAAVRSIPHGKPRNK